MWLIEHILVAVVATLLGAFGRRIAGGLWSEVLGRRSPGGDIPIRLVFAGCVGLASALAGAPGHAAALIGALTFVGSTTGNNGGLALGRVVLDSLVVADAPIKTPSGLWVGIDPVQWRRDAWGLTRHGLESVAGPMLAIWLMEFGRGGTLEGLAAALGFRAALHLGGIHLEMTAPAHWSWALGVAWIPVLLSGLMIVPCYAADWRLCPYQGPYEGWTRSAAWPVWLRLPPRLGEYLWGGCLGLGTALAVWLALAGW